jgi:membrane protein
MHYWMRLSPSSRALPVHLWRAIINFKNYGLRNAAALSYYAVFSVFPLALLLTVGISALLGSTVATEQITKGISLFLPDETETIKLIQDSVKQAVDQGSSFGVIAGIGLIWSALGLFSNLTASLDRIFEVPSSRSMWTQRLLAFLMTFAMILLVGVSFIASGLLGLINAFLLSSPSIWIRIGILFLPLGLNLVIFVMLFRYVPARHVEWDAVWPAAILGAIALELAKAGFTWYLTNLANFQVVYGGIATGIVLLLWAYLVTSILLICAEICAQLNLWFRGPIDETSQPKIIIEQGQARLPTDIPPPA